MESSKYEILQNAFYFDIDEISQSVYQLSQLADVCTSRVSIKSILLLVYIQL